MTYLHYFVCEKIDDVDFVFRDVEDYHLILPQHPKAINGTLVFFLKENFPLGVKVNDAMLLSNLSYPGNNKSIVAGHRSAKYFEHWWIEINSNLFLDNHRNR